MAEIPDEREITKQQLWSRIDTAIETIALVGRNTQDNLNAALPALKRENELSLAEFKNTLKNTIDDMQAFIDGKIKFLEKLNNDGFGKMVNEGQRIRIDVDKRFQSLGDELDQSMKNQIAESFAQISGKIAEFNDNVIAYKKQGDQQISSLQKEWLSKLGETKAALDDMKKKFKKISEQLS